MHPCTHRAPTVHPRAPRAPASYQAGARCMHPCTIVKPDQKFHFGPLPSFLNSEVGAGPAGVDLGRGCAATVERVSCHGGARVLPRVLPRCLGGSLQQAGRGGGGGGRRGATPRSGGAGGRRQGRCDRAHCIEWRSTVRAHAHTRDTRAAPTVTQAGDRPSATPRRHQQSGPCPFLSAGFGRGCATWVHPASLAKTGPAPQRRPCRTPAPR